MMGNRVFASGASIVRVPPVLAPISLKLFVPGVPDEPEKNINPNGLVAEPMSAAPAVPGNKDVLIATEARLERATTALVPNAVFRSIWSESVPLIDPQVPPPPPPLVAPAVQLQTPAILWAAAPV